MLFAIFSIVLWVLLVPRLDFLNVVRSTPKVVGILLAPLPKGFGPSFLSALDLEAHPLVRMITIRFECVTTDYAGLFHAANSFKQRTAHGQDTH